MFLQNLVLTCFYLCSILKSFFFHRTVEVRKGPLEVPYSNLLGPSRAIQSKLQSSTSWWWGRQGAVVSETAGGNSQETNVKRGVCQGHITSSTGEANFCSKAIPGYIHLSELHCSGNGKMGGCFWQQPYLTYTETPAQTWLPAGTSNCTLSRPEHASTLQKNRC